MVSRLDGPSMAKDTTESPGRSGPEAGPPRAVTKDEREFQALYESLAPALYAWAQLKIRPAMRVHVDPQDLVQEVWLRAVGGYEKVLASDGNLRAWVFKIAKNVLLESFRRLRTQPLGDPHAGPSTRLFALKNCPESVTSISQRLARDDTVQRFVEAARAYGQEERQLLVRCGLERQTCAEVATRLGLSEDAVIKRWQRLRAKLRERPWAHELLLD